MRFLFFLFAPVAALCQPGADAMRLKKILLENHYQPCVIDDAFSQHVYERTLNLLDPHRLYFTSEDLLPLQSFRTAIDDEWNSGKVTFVQQLTGVWTSAQKKVLKHLAEQSRTRIAWNGSDILDRGTDISPAKDDGMLRERWKLWIKYKVLEAVESSTALDSPRVAITLDDLLREEKQQVQRVVESESKTIRAINAFPGGAEAKVYTLFLKAIVAEYDPHSLYLSPAESEEFVGEITSQSFSFGMELHENAAGDIVVDRLVPGGPAWKSGELHKSDVLAGLKIGSRPPVNLEGVGLDSLDELLGGDNHLSVELTLRRPDGQRRTISLRKERITDDSNIVKGFVLKGRNKIGYISLPGFYSEWGSDQGSSCAGDMARQILKLKRENIQGLIVDIRSNGGGSVKEAIELAGIFIDEGPISLFRNNKGNLITVKDVNRGTVYDGPLVLLVDGRSASASEMLAAALQDYNRAIVMGSATFGKGTSQRIFSLDPASEIPRLDPKQRSPYGFATVTIEKIYRVTGKSVQGHGVVPDIPVPSVYDLIVPHEASMPQALPADSVSPRVAFRAKPPIPLAALRMKSSDRILSNPWFNRLQETKKMIDARIKNRDRINLNWNIFLNSAPAGSLTPAVHSIATKTITAPEYDRASIQRNAWERENNDRWIRNLNNDEYVSEAFLVLDDYISIKNQP